MEALSAEHEAEWQRLRAQLELAAGFWLGFVFVDHAGIAASLCVRTTRVLRAHARASIALRPSSPEALEGVLNEVFARGPSASGCLFIECVNVDTTPDGAWSRAWEALLLRSNERRDALRRALPGGLVFVLARSFKPLVRNAAPDLWSVRSIVLELLPKPISAPAGRGEESTRTTRALVQRVATLDPELAEQEAARLQDPAAQGIALRRAAEGHVARGNVHDAIRTASQAVEHLASAPSEQYARELARARHVLGSAEHLAGDPGAAREHLEAALGGTAEEALEQRSEILGELGELMLETGELEQAQAVFLEVVALRRSGIDRSGEDPETIRNLTMTTSQGLRDVLVSLSNVGNVTVARGDVFGAQLAYEESLELSRRLLSEHGESPQGLRDVSIGLDNVGDIKASRGDVSGAQSAYEESLALRRRLLSAYGESVHALRDVSVSLNKVGNIKASQGDVSGAQSAYEESLALRRRLLSEYGESPRGLRDVSVSLNNVGDIKASRGDVSGAQSAYEESLELSRRVLSAYGESPQGLRDLSFVLDKLADVLRRRGKDEAADRLSEESQAARRRLNAVPSDSEC